MLAPNAAICFTAISKTPEKPLTDLFLMALVLENVTMLNLITAWTVVKFRAISQLLGKRFEKGGEQNDTSTHT